MKLVIYQVFTRTFGNKNSKLKPNGTLAENGVGKMNDFDVATLQQIKSLGVNTIGTLVSFAMPLAPTILLSVFHVRHHVLLRVRLVRPTPLPTITTSTPDIADNVAERMSEFDDLVKRTHKESLKVIIDFVPNHVAREYKSICKQRA